jgi:AraC family transcriptional regulator, transcriptional activator of pobA
LREVNATQDVPGFIRAKANKEILEKFDTLLIDYYQSDKPQTIGLPSVAYCASELNLSANYFGDLIKKETGKTAQEYIQSKVIDAAKEKIFDLSKSVSEVAYELGFKYPQHFTRLFKQRLVNLPTNTDPLIDRPIELVVL